MALTMSSFIPLDAHFQFGEHAGRMFAFDHSCVSDQDLRIETTRASENYAQQWLRINGVPLHQVAKMTFAKSFAQAVLLYRRDVTGRSVS